MTTNEEKDVIKEENEIVEVNSEETIEEATEVVEEEKAEATEESKEVEDTTAELMKEAALAAQREAAIAERDRINTKLCYDRALAQFYEEEGINPEDEKDAKEKEEERQKELDNMTYGQELKYRYNEFMSDMKNPLRKKIRINHFSGVVISIFRAIILFGLCFIIFMPIFEKLSFALRHPLDINNPQVVWIPEKWSILNFQIANDLLTKEGPTYWNTIILSTISMLLQIIATAIPGYAFARLKFRGSNVIFYIIVASLAIPNEALKVARSLFFNNYGFFGYSLIGSAIAIYIMTIFGQGLRSAIFIFLFRQAFRNLPIELEESAEIDGAGVIRTFWNVMLPNVRGTVITVGLFAFVWQYNDYYFADLFSYSRNKPLLTTSLAGATQNLNSVISTQYPHLAMEMGDVIGGEFYELITQSAALLMMAPVLIGYLFVQRAFVESVERSGLTGM